jgi:hypothetical protein
MLGDRFSRFVISEAVIVIENNAKWIINIPPLCALREIFQSSTLLLLGASPSQDFRGQGFLSDIISQTLKADPDIFILQFDPDGFSSGLVGHRAGRKGAGKRIQDGFCLV